MYHIYTQKLGLDQNLQPLYPKQLADVVSNVTLDEILDAVMKLQCLLGKSWFVYAKEV